MAGKREEWGRELRRGCRIEKLPDPSSSLTLLLLVRVYVFGRLLHLIMLVRLFFSFLSSSSHKTQPCSLAPKIQIPSNLSTLFPYKKPILGNPNLGFFKSGSRRFVKQKTLFLLTSPPWLNINSPYQDIPTPIPLPTTSS